MCVYVCVYLKQNDEYKSIFPGFGARSVRIYLTCDSETPIKQSHCSIQRTYTISKMAIAKCSHGVMRSERIQRG